MDNPSKLCTFGKKKENETIDIGYQWWWHRSPGIRNLVEVVSSFGEVVVVAPDKPQSGQGHAITLNQPIRLRKVDLFDGLEAYECSGTPVDCVKLAKNVFFLKNRTIDLLCQWY